jgi:hypothetical protein
MNVKKVEYKKGKHKKVANNKKVTNEGYCIRWSI